MANKEKKRKDKKSKQRRERKGKLPSSVEALLGYLGGGGPSPAPQGDTRVRERAGVDGYDTLHQIIKAQQMMSMGYMANLEKMAYRNELNEQIKKQGEENKKQIDDTLKQATQSSKVSQKIGKVGKQILWHMNLKNPTASQKENLQRLEGKLQKYESQFDFESKINSYQNPTQAPPNPQAGLQAAASVAPSQSTANVRAGGGGSARVFVASAQGTSDLPAFDPSPSFIASHMGALSPKPPISRAAAELQGGMEAFQSLDLAVSSGNIPNLVQMSRNERQQNKQIKRMEAELIKSGALDGDGAPRRSARFSSNK